MLANNRNIISGFQLDLLLPLCFTLIKIHLEFIEDSIILEYAPNLTCIRCCNKFQTEVLLFHPATDRSPHRRHAIDVKNILLYHEHFNQIDA